MQRITPISRSNFVKGTWRNGRGVSWDIASDQAFGAERFGWRFALAEIAASGPFSHYPSVDRVFTLVEGDGVDLEFNGGKALAVHQRHVPHGFPCDVPTHCTLRGDRALALNLFIQRGEWRADVEIVDVKGTLSLPVGFLLVFVLQGSVTIGNMVLEQGDAARIQGSGHCEASSRQAKLYLASLGPCGATLPVVI